jgi:hypothetical protein
MPIIPGSITPIRDNSHLLRNTVAYEAVARAVMAFSCCAAALRWAVRQWEPAQMPLPSADLPS